MFEEALKVDLTVKTASKNHIIPGGNVKNFSLHMTGYGFEGMVEFWVSLELESGGTDPLFTDLTKADLLEVELEVEAYYNQPTPAPQPLVVKGLVTKKALFEKTFRKVDQHPILFRRYTLHFADPMKVLWSQHFPSALYVDSTMEDVIKSQVVEGISLTLDWTPLQTKHPIVCLPLGKEKNKASFYDFFFWYIHDNNGVLEYTHHKNSYSLTGAKNTEGDPVKADWLEIERLEVAMGETPRYKRRVLNSYTESAQTQEIANEEAVAPMRQDYLMRTSITSEVTARKTLETNRLQLPEPGVEVIFKQYPTSTVRPGTFVKFEGGKWSTSLHVNGKEYRLTEIHLQAEGTKQAPEEDRDEAFAGYQVQMTMSLETKAESKLSFPTFQKPHYPLHIEGNIFSEKGEPVDKTYQIYEGANSKEFYKVNVVLWNQKVIVPFEPHLVPGHFYFPGFKGTRVLLALNLHSAEIKRYLAWGSGVKLPQSGQGNHLLFGKNSLSETSIQHIYEEDKPKLIIKRINEKDTSLIQAEEGAFTWEVKELDQAPEQEEEYNVVPRVAAAKGELSMKATGSISEVTAEFGTAKAKAEGAISDAVGETEAKLDEMDAELSGKIDEVSGKVEGALANLGQKGAEIKAKGEEVKASLKSMIEL